jgi:hypothetical protein
VLVYEDNTSAFEWVGIEKCAQLVEKEQSEAARSQMYLRLAEWMTVCPAAAAVARLFPLLGRSH